jgi:hypothetical protein
MNRTGVLSLLLLFGSQTLMAQTSGNQPTGSVVVRLARFQTNCGPIGIQARMDNSLNVLTEANDRPTQRVRITLNNANSVEIVASQITVHGVTTMSETPPAVPQKVAKTLELELKVGAGQDAFLDVSVQGFTAVSYIELDSAGYADGSSWHPSDGKTCTILPHSLLGTGR